MRRGSDWVAAALTLLALSPVMCAGTIPEITSPVTTQFGTYTPVHVAVSPRARQFALDPSLTGVENAGDFLLSTRQRELLSTQGFFVTPLRERLASREYATQPTAYRNFADIYREGEVAHIPPFITSDALLHAFHRLFDDTLRSTEETKLVPQLQALLAGMLADVAATHDVHSNPDIVEAARLAGTYLVVAMRLLDPSVQAPEWTAPALAQELALIEAHQGISLCPLFRAFKENYSQYVPRGHYTRSETLGRYFKAMMWLGRMSFALRSYDFEQPDAKGEARIDLAAAALLLLHSLDRDPGATSLQGSWSTIWTTTVFFVGEGDDAGPADYRALARTVWGKPPGELAAAEICNRDKLQAFIALAERELPEPRIRSTAPRGMRLFGQRFVPDSYYFSELVFPAVQATPDGEYRLFPSVLDIVSVLGSAEAERLQRTAGEERFPNYLAQIAALRDEVVAGGAEQWAATLYWSWLYTLDPLLREWGEGFPPFMRGPAWARRQLAATAGSWTELRHDTILYTKQSSSGATGGPQALPFVQGYVEPNPELFARLAALAAYARAGLGGLSVLDSTAAGKLQKLESAALLLADVAARELERRPVMGEQFAFIYAFGRWLDELLRAQGSSGSDSADPNDRAPVVADVHTDPNTARVLEEGTGYPGRLVVVADVEGRLQICVGAVFVPFEFRWPMDNRLTDEAWWTLLAETPPALPAWTQLLYDRGALAPGQSHGAWASAVEPGAITATLVRDTVPAGNDLELVCTPRPQTVELRPQDGAAVRITVAPGSGHVLLPTRGLAPGELIVVVDTGASGSYALRATLLAPPTAPRRRVRGS
jgi:hypothetical protein